MAAPDGLPHPALFTALGEVGRPGAGFSFHLLPRHGVRPFGFFGRMLFSCADQGAPGQRDTSHLVVHEIAGGGFCAAIRHQRRGGQTAIWQTALAAPDAASLAELLREHDPVHVPLDAGCGLPGGPDGVAQSWRGVLGLVCLHAA